MTLVLWLVGISLAFFFGTLAFTRWHDRERERKFPNLLLLLPSEVEALKSARVHVPRSFHRERLAPHLYALRLSNKELFQLQAIVMNLAQERIARAARSVREGRGTGTLGGRTYSFSTLASYLTDATRTLAKRLADAPSQAAENNPHIALSRNESELAAPSQIPHTSP